jgi:hypothetical protein
MKKWTCSACRDTVTGHSLVTDSAYNSIPQLQYSTERASDRPSKRSSQRASERSIDRALE